MKTSLFILFLIINTFFLVDVDAKGYLHANGRDIVDENEAIFLLKGMGLGGWMVQEPYMMLVSDCAPAGQHTIFSDVEALIGAEKLKSYHNAWLKSYCTEADVVELKASGFNSIRLPMHYNLYTLPIEEEPVIGQDTWLTTGFELTDSLLAWCKKHEIYLILDLHAAPGGQGKDANISDYDTSKPSLWESDENKRKTVALWGKLAQRYANEPWIGGCDLINETNWSFGGDNINGTNDQVNAPLKALYALIIAEIRKVDSNHLIFIEGNGWANNHNGLWPIVDSNVALSFHKYWNENTMSAIQGFLNLSIKYNVPIWMGEAGENNNQWYSDAVELLENNNIGWAWWSWKKMNSTSGSYSISPPASYQTLINYWKNGGTKPSSTEAFSTMMAVADAARLKNCTRNSGAITALTKERKTCAKSSYLPISSRLQAENYCQMLGVQSEACSDMGGGFDLGWSDANDWMAYNIAIPDSGKYLIKYRVSSLIGGGIIHLFSSKTDTILGSVNIPQTSGWQLWTTISHETNLLPGDQTLTLRVKNGGFNFNWFEISKVADPVTDNNPSTSVVINLFPNPCINQLTVEPKNVEIVSYSVVDLGGQLLNKQTIPLQPSSQLTQSSFTIDMSSYSVGTYLILLQAKTKVFCKRIIKMEMGVEG